MIFYNRVKAFSQAGMQNFASLPVNVLNIQNLTTSQKAFLGVKFSSNNSG